MRALKGAKIGRDLQDFDGVVYAKLYEFTLPISANNHYACICIRWLGFASEDQIIDTHKYMYDLVKRRVESGSYKKRRVAYASDTSMFTGSYSSKRVQFYFLNTLTPAFEVIGISKALIIESNDSLVQASYEKTKENIQKNVQNALYKKFSSVTAAINFLCSKLRMKPYDNVSYEGDILDKDEEEIARKENLLRQYQSELGATRKILEVHRAEAAKELAMHRRETKKARKNNLAKTIGSIAFVACGVFVNSFWSFQNYQNTRVFTREILTIKKELVNHKTKESHGRQNTSTKGQKKSGAKGRRQVKEGSGK